MTLAGETIVRKRPRSAAVAAVRKPAAKALLAWYDLNRRDLPWRAKPGKRQDPYRVWLSEIMLQQTTVKAVAPYYARFIARWPNVRGLAAAPLAQILSAWAGLGYYARARNLHACARAVVAAHGGKFPQDEDALRVLPGIGAYTAAAIAAIAFDRKATPIDGNIERVVARLFAVGDLLPSAKAEIRVRAQTLTPARRPGDFAQALMDLGATLCTPKRPACALCPWTEACEAHRRGDPESFPRKAPKVEGRLRRGAAFVVLREDAILVRTRPAKGLLGGMTEVPTTEWTNGFEPSDGPAHAPLKGAWRKLPGVVTHAFTHFPLELVIYRAQVGKGAKAPRGARFVPLRALDREALPSVMRKVIAHALRKSITIEDGHAP